MARSASSSRPETRSRCTRPTATHTRTTSRSLQYRLACLSPPTALTRWTAIRGTSFTCGFFLRSSVQSDLPTANPNPDSWGLPTTAYPTSSCNTDQFIKPRTLILDITICGNFAGAASVFDQTCSGTCTDLVKTPSNYDNAYFQISYIRVFAQGVSSAASAVGTTTGADGATSSTGAGSRWSVSSFLTIFMLGLSILLL